MSRCKQPFNCRCSLVAGLQYLLTVTRRRSQLNCCLDLGANLHFSRSGLCLSSSVSWNSASPSPLVPTAETAPMPHLHQRMHCRRGSTRGQPLCAPSSPSTESSSQSIDYHAGRYPDTRSGRGQVLGSGHRMGSPAPHFPTASPSPTTRTALFSFNFSLKCPQITT